MKEEVDMRCPACTQRNSVASNKCKFCGQNLKPKQLPSATKAVAAVAALSLLVGVGSAIGSLFAKPEPRVGCIAQRMAAGPKSSEEAQLMRVQLDASLLKYLEQYGRLASPDLLTKLQSELPSSAFEVLVFDLPNAIKLVEVDCVLHPSNYLVVPARGGVKVSRISGLSVFDGCRLIPAKPEPCLVMLGHTTGDGPRRPQLAAVGLKSTGEISDKTGQVFPVIKGCGTANFSGTSYNIKIDRMLASAATEGKLFVSEIPLKDEPFSTTLKWKNDRYKAHESLGTSELAALYAVATSLLEPREADQYGAYLSLDVRSGIKAMEEKPVLAPGAFKILKAPKGTSRRRRSHRNDGDTGSYLLVSGERAFQVGLIKSGRWSVVSLKETSAPDELTAIAVRKSMDQTAQPVRQDNTDAKIVVKSLARETGKSAIAREPRHIAGMAGGTSRSEVKVEKKSEPKPGQSKSVASRKNSGWQSQEASARKERKENSKERIIASPPWRGTAKIATETSGCVTMRNGPGRHSRSLVNIPGGAAVRILGEKDGWCKISFNGQEGYVYKSYVNQSRFESSPLRVALREKPSLSRRPEKSEKASVTTPQKNNKNSKYRTRLSSGKAPSVDHAAPVGQGDEPDFVP